MLYRTVERFWSLVDLFDIGQIFGQTKTISSLTNYKSYKLNQQWTICVLIENFEWFGNKQLIKKTNNFWNFIDEWTCHGDNAILFWVLLFLKLWIKKLRIFVSSKEILNYYMHELNLHFGLVCWNVLSLITHQLQGINNNKFAIRINEPKIFENKQTLSFPYSTSWNISLNDYTKPKVKNNLIFPNALIFSYFAHLLFIY